jgi:hypothetical protein
MKNVFVSKHTNGIDWKAEARQLRRTGKRITASRTASLRLLVATGMHTATGKLKPQFR